MTCIQRTFLLLSLIWTFSLASTLKGTDVDTNMATIPWDMPLTAIDEKETSLAPWKGQVLLIVNTATKCGLSFQLEELETLYKKYKDQGFSILAFPSNDFLQQEPGSNSEVQEVCSARYHLTFPLFAKIHVRGAEISPLFTWLSTKQGSLSGGIMWNYTKFLINRDGKLVARFSPMTSPSSPSVSAQIESCLNAAPAAP